MRTTLNQLQEHDPWDFNSEAFLKILGTNFGGNDPIPFKLIIEKAPYPQSLKFISASDGYQRELRLFAVWCFLKVAPKGKHAAQDKIGAAVSAALSYADNKITEEQFLEVREKIKEIADPLSLLMTLVLELLCPDARDAAVYTAHRAAHWSALKSTSLEDPDAAAVKEAQKAEFLRMLECIESQTLYSIEDVFTDAAS